MLKGRESLIRLVGRRRRFLCRRHSLLTSSAPQHQIGCKEYKDEVSTENGNVDEEEWVDCPVCGKKIRGEDRVVNSHLDKFLARGSKRKLSQCILFQLNICTRPKVTVSSIELDVTRIDVGPSTDDDGPENDIQDESKSSVCNRVNRMENLDGLLKLDDERKLLSDAKTMQIFGLEGSPQHQITDDRIDNIADSPLSLSEKRMPKCVEPSEDDDNSEILLDTFVVGRRFGNDGELTVGGMIMLSRDPENVKDQNAIKVLTKDTDHNKELGYIPRELAQYLSPLIDKFHLRFEAVSCEVHAVGKEVRPNFL